MTAATAVRRPRKPVTPPRGGRPDLRFEKELLRSGAVRLAAMDEVGRGALAGPVTVGVVVVTGTIGRVPAGLKDSKLLSPAVRQRLVTPVRRWVGEYAVGHASPDEIDAWGIIAALRAAGRRALAQLAGPVDLVLLDGSHDYLTWPAPPPVTDEPADPELFPADTWTGPTPQPLSPPPGFPAVAQDDLPVRVRIKADLTCAAVAGASVLAKTERDGLLVDLHDRHPQYGFAINKGYGTAEHVDALRNHGPSPVHRRSWRLPTGDAEREG
ncbi:ribonuclease HII [Nakamurella flavida]|uniref:Ribonuclease n=1 Tax=Nakamurella flavida TaxID=363630 RepID=A0A938YHR1_9ACTN|nr:ribonuclease HII [Nakamurella flavida]MBM9476137.1 ribonuclease HII [Nakamurella flavida]MDP9777118.1 ribonuclease HII [Nakamurella flavida]